MKKIGLVTIYNTSNIGAMLQAYALQENINKCRFETYVISRDRFNQVKVLDKTDDSDLGRKESKLEKVIKFVNTLYLFTVLFADSAKQTKRDAKEEMHWRRAFEMSI